jgi:hypothetical protein
MKRKFLVLALLLFAVPAGAISAWRVASLLVTSGGITFVRTGSPHIIAPEDSTAGHPGDIIELVGGKGASGTSGGRAYVTGGAGTGGGNGADVIINGGVGASYGGVSLCVSGGQCEVGSGSDQIVFHGDCDVTVGGVGGGGGLSMGVCPIVDLADPANAQDAATKAYVDVKWLKSTSGTPGCVLGSASGSGGTPGCTASGTSDAGILTLITGTGGFSGDALFTVTFANSATAATGCSATFVFNDSTTGAYFNQFSRNVDLWVTTTTTGWTLHTSNNSFGGMQTFKFNYLVKCW